MSIKKNTLRISNRAEGMQASPIRKLYPHAIEAKKKGVTVYHLNIGQPDVPTPKQIFEGIKNFNDPVLPYGPSDGIPELREEIAKYFGRFGVQVSPSEVFITTGGSEAILFAFLLVGDYGDEVLVPEPFYTNYQGFAQQVGINLRPIPTSVEEGFHLPSYETIKKLVNDRTRAILLCSPNNPTGTIYEDEEFESVIKVVKEHGLNLLVDEVYREFAFDGRKPVTTLRFEEIHDRLIVLDSISKRFSACGARVGFIVTKNREFLEAFMKMGQARLCPPTIEQWGAVYGFKYIDEFIGPMIAEYEKRRNAVFDELAKIPRIEARKPEGAFYTVVKLPVENAEDFAVWLLKDFNENGKTLMVAPAESFYLTPGKGVDEVRIAYVLEEEKLREAIRILGKALEVYNSRR
ncbi:MAG: pyridoxal phosphate-dependent aminotransferase [bacterium]|nr:pyridoxal phosphate-dependent aminotransferase [bacterium]